MDMPGRAGKKGGKTVTLLDNERLQTPIYLLVTIGTIEEIGF